MRPIDNRIAAFLAATSVLTVSGTAYSKEFGAWQAPVNAEDLSGSSSLLNTEVTEGCPILAPYTDDLFFASNRSGGCGLDIWRAAWTGDGWGEPVNTGSPVVSGASDYCPTPVRGNTLFFVSQRDDPAGDIYRVKYNKNGNGAPERLPAPINSAAQEWSPSYYERDDGTPVLYFSSTRGGSHDIYVSENWGPPQPVAELNSSAADARPNVSRDGLEIVFDTTRDGGPPDIWAAYRSSATSAWSAPDPIVAVNSPSGESRASLSWDGTVLVFGSAREGGDGGSDIYVSTRSKLAGPKTVEFD